MGGQGIPNLDNDLAPYVAKSYIRNIANYLEITCSTDIYTLKREFIKPLDEYIRENKRIMNQSGREYITDYLKDKFNIYHINFTNMYEYATNKTERDTYQAMESMVHNLCSLASRAGGQVPFSSVNFGIDTTEEGRMVSRNIMLAIDAGLGSGETSIFPIAIMKLMSGVTDKGSHNYDLFQLSCKVSAKRLFPNWLSLDATFNKKYYKGTPETEVATMGMVDGGIIKIRHITNEGKIYLKDIDISELGDWLLEYNIGKVTKDENKEIDLRIYDIENVDILDSYYGGWTKLNVWIKTQDPSLRWYRIKTNKGTNRIFSHDHPLTAIIPEKHTSWQRIPVEDLSVGDKLMGTDQYNQVITSIEKVDENIVGYDVNTNSDRFDLDAVVVHNCISEDSKIVLKDPHNRIIYTTAKYFEKLDEGIHYLKDWKILSNGKFVDLINVAIRYEYDEINVIRSAHGTIKVTNDHVIPVIRNREYIEIPAKEVIIDDCLVSDTDCRNVLLEQRIDELNLINRIGLSDSIYVIYPDSYEEILDKFIFEGKVRYMKKYNTLYSTLSEYKFIRNNLIINSSFNEHDLQLKYQKSKTSIPAILPLTRKLGRFIGLLYSEGSVLDYDVVLTNSDKNIIDFITNFTSSTLGLQYTISYNKNNTAIIHISNKLFSSLFKNGILGNHYGSGNLKLPNWYFSANEEFLKGFLGGVIDGDGSVVPQNYTRIITASETFAADLQYLIMILGYTSCVSIDRLKGTIAKFGDIESIRKFDNYRITIDNRDVVEMNLYDAVKPHKLDGFEFKERSRDRKYGNRVFSIEKMMYDGYVYDFETGDSHFDCNMQNLHNCRTRVIGNHFDPDNEVTPGRGNLFFTTVNLPYLALQAKREYDTGKYTCTLYDVFMSMLNETIDEVFDLSMDRFEIIANKKAKNFPFLMGQGLYIGSDNLSPDDTIREVIKHGTITMGFIGLAETLVVLTGKHHGESEASQELGLKIISHMNQRCTDECHKTGLNFSLMGSPAEGCCGRLLRLTRKEFGTIPGVTDHEYLTNSHHIPVYYPISAKRKVDIEAPYHELEPAG